MKALAAAVKETLLNFSDVEIRAVSISLFQFRYNIDKIFTKYRDIDIDIK